MILCIGAMQERNLAGGKRHGADAVIGIDAVEDGDVVLLARIYQPRADLLQLMRHARGLIINAIRLQSAAGRCIHANSNWPLSRMGDRRTSGLVVETPKTKPCDHL